MSDLDRVRRLLGGPGLIRFVDQLESRVRRGQPLAGGMALSGVDGGERAAIAALFGRQPGAGSSTTADLDLLAEIVIDSGAAESLREAVELLRGPIVVASTVAEAEQRSWDTALSRLDPLIAARPHYASWATRMRTTGVVRRAARTPDAAAVLLDRVVMVLLQLPVEGESLARFAARVLGSAHALDRDTQESSLVLSALQGGQPGPATAERRRELWNGVGIVLDELSSTVLIHRLPLPGPLGELTAAGEPVVLTLRQLRSLNVTPPDEPVFVCENPSVVEAAANELGAASAPLVCVNGQPSLAVGLLLRRLAPAGLRYHGDFDWGGIRIANRIFSTVGFVPWRYCAADLESIDVPGVSLSGAPVEALWDSRLGSSLSNRGSRVEEEQVVESLLEDLSAPPRGGN